jgi:nitroreductase
MDENVLDIIRKRRTVRKFTDQEVTGEQIETLLELAMCAPNRLNRRPWEFVVIRDRTVQGQLATFLRVHPYLEAASAVIAVCARPSRSPTWMMDVSAAIENMLIGATAMGLGTAWVGSPDTVMWTMCEELLHDVLAIPLDVRVVALVAVGYPAQELPPHGRHDRFEGTKIHYGHWDNRQLT